MTDDGFEEGAGALSERLLVALSKLGLALRSNERETAGEKGLSPTQGQILALLRARGAPLRLNEIAKSLGVTAPTASDSVRALEEKALVKKERDPADARAIAIRLTSQGSRAGARTLGWPDFLLEAADGLDALEQEALLVSLLKMIRALQERGRIPLSRMCVDCVHFRPHAHDDAERPHHCALVDAPFGPRALRLDCPDHERADDDGRSARWARFSLTRPQS